MIATSCSTTTSAHLRGRLSRVPRRTAGSTSRLTSPVYRSQVRRLVFTVTGEQAGPGNTQFTLTGADGGYATYSTAAAELSGEKALILAELYLKDEWRLAAVGQGFQGGLEALLEHFGGQTASPQSQSLHSLNLHSLSNPHLTTSRPLNPPLSRDRITLSSMDSNNPRHPCPYKPQNQARRLVLHRQAIRGISRQLEARRVRGCKGPRAFGGAVERP